MKLLKRLVVVLILAAVALSVTMPWWKPATDRTKWGVVAAHLAHNAARRIGAVSGQIDDPYAQPRSESEIPAMLSTLDSAFQQLVEFAQLTPDVLAGAHVLEIGPGNTIGIPLLFIGAGAARTAAIDKFVPLQDTPFHRRLYTEMRARLDDTGRKRFDSAIRLSERVEPIAGRLDYVTGRGIEDAPWPAATFDVVVSNAVLMEVYEADATFAAIDRVLKPGGRMAHVIDLSDYSLFAKRGFHPLEFLTIPDAIYRNMSESIGQPNRRLVDYYRDKMASLGYETTIFITNVTAASGHLKPFKTRLTRGVDYGDAQVTLVNEIRPRLLERYRKLSDEDLLTAGILLVARKPAAR